MPGGGARRRSSSAMLRLLRLVLLGLAGLLLAILAGIAPQLSVANAPHSCAYDLRAHNALERAVTWSAVVVLSEDSRVRTVVGQITVIACSRCCRRR